MSDGSILMRTCRPCVAVKRQRTNSRITQILTLGPVSPGSARLCSARLGFLPDWLCGAASSSRTQTSSPGPRISCRAAAGHRQPPSRVRRSVPPQRVTAPSRPHLHLHLLHRYRLRLVLFYFYFTNVSLWRHLFLLITVY